ncbi:MAG: TfoX/Sxy family protein [Pygmaiobacter sp.]|nr:TfoX/Sxy family protein [Pygmaiobacter sp.]
MASSPEFVTYVCEQVAPCGIVRSRKMFGEYMIYVNDRPLLLVCDNTVFIKKLPCVATLLAAAEVGIPYPGAKEYYILDIDDRTLSHKVVAALLPFVDLPKPRKHKKN